MTKSAELLRSLKPMNYSARAGKILEKMPEGLDAIIISHLTNVRYASGFTGSNGLIFLSGDKFVFITDGRYKTQSREQLEAAGVDAEIFVTSQGEGPMSFLEKLISKGMSVGLEANSISWAGANTYIEKFVDATFVPTSGVVEKARIVKEADEVDRIRAACRIADDALEMTLPMLVDLPTEKQFALALDRQMVDLGAAGNSFDTITAFGKRAALPHAMPSDAKIEPNKLIVIDFGCVVDGYASDMTRTVSVGEVDDKQKLMFDQVIESQKRGSEFVKSGVPISEIDESCRSYLRECEVEQYFTHSTGHGVGLDVHEEPWVRAADVTMAQSGNILTVEPGIYIEGFAGVRIEDTLHVTDTGSETLTCAPKTLVVG